MLSKPLWWVAAVIGLLLATAAAVVYRVFYPRLLRLGSGPVRVACVGDSITYGLGVIGRRRRWSYPAFLREFLGEDYSFFNYGLTGRTLLPGKSHYFSEKLGKAAWETPADILIFMLGSNDSKKVLWDPERFEQAYREVLAHYQQMGCFRQICVMLPPKIFTPRPGEKGCNNRILEEEILPVIRRAAEDCGVTLIDLHTLTRDHPEWFPDRLHPNREGNRAIAWEIAARIQRLY